MGERTKCEIYCTICDISVKKCDIFDGFLS